MTKEFKQYDRMYARYMHTTLDWEHISVEEVELTAVIENVTKWGIIVEQWTQEHVNWAVYHAKDYLEWQKFRVSMRGFSTAAKLVRLKKYYEVRLYDELKRMEHAANLSPEDEYTDMMRKHRAIEKCRIDNYIGALRRGGFLNENYEVVKG